MASDQAQYNRALRNWDALHEQGRYSVPLEQGAVAILWSDFTMGEPEDREKEIRAFSEDAYGIAGRLASAGIDCQVFGSYTLDDAAEVLADPEYASIITIGNGNLSATYCHNGESFDWRFVAKHAKHLKTGRFMQRHCGQAIRELSAPLGTFALHEHSNVYAAYDTYLPTVMDAAYEAKIDRIHPYRRLGYRALKSLFPRYNGQDQSSLLNSADDKPDSE